MASSKTNHITSVEAIDKEMIHGLKVGDRKAFDALFDQFYLPLCKYAYSIINDYEESSQLVQDRFVKLWEHRENLDVHQNLRSYLFRMIHNSCINYLKHLKVREKYLEHLGHHANDLYVSNRDELVEKEIEGRIDEVISSLSPKCRRVFEMSRFEGKKYREIAAELSLTQKTVESHMTKALKELRNALEEYLILLVITLNLYVL